MSKISLTNLVNLQNQTTAVNAINANNAVLTTAFDNTLSRDGTTPNTMGSALDMNSNQIINLPAPSTVNSPARLIDVTSNPTIVVPGTGTSGHTVPFLDGNNTWSGTNTFGSETVTGTATFNNAIVVPANTIANASLSTMAANTVKGSIAGGTPSDLTKTQITTLINPVTSSLSGAIPAYPNDTTKFFRGDGTYSVPTASAYTLLNTLTASNSVTLSDITSFTNAYSIFIVEISNLVPITNNGTLFLQVHSGGSFFNSGYICSEINCNGSAVAAQSNTVGLQIGSAANLSNANPGLSASITVVNPSQTSFGKLMYGNYTHLNGSTLYTGQTSGIWTSAATAVDGFQLVMGTGNISSGTVKIYGVV